MNRAPKIKNDKNKEEYREVLLEPNKKQGLTNDQFYTLVSEEDYDKIKNFNWKISVIGGNFTAVAFIKGKYQTITSVMWPNLKRIHRVNNNTLDNRRSNVKYWVNKKKTEKQVNINHVGQNTLEDAKKEETKMFVLSASNYDAIKKIAEYEGLEDHDSAVTLLLDSHKRYNDLLKPKIKCAEMEEPKTCSCDCHTTFWDRLKAKLLGRLL